MSVVKSVELSISDRMEDLLKENKITSQELSKQTNISKATISDIINGQKKGYNYEYFIRFAKFFNVTTDFLFGLTDAKTVDKDIRAICDYTGLTEEAIRTLHMFKNSIFVEFCNYYICKMCEKDKKETNEDDIPFNEPTIGFAIKDCCDLTRTMSSNNETSERLFDLSDVSKDILKSLEGGNYLDENLVIINGEKYLITDMFNNAFNEFIELKGSESNEPKKS